MGKKLLTHKYSSILLALIAMLLALPSVWTGWQQDDFNQRYFLLGNPGLDGKPSSPLDIFAFLNGDPERTRKIMDLGLVPWWTLENLRLSFWRPLSAASHWLDYALWPNSAPLMHIQSLFWLGALIAAAAALYKRVMGVTWAAGLAALFFAIDDAHGLPAGWIANRNALIAGCFGVIMLLVHHKWRQQNWRAGAILGPVLLLLGLLSGEVALGAIGYLVAYSVFLDPGSRRERFLVVLPYGIVTAFWFVAYNVMGYGTWGSGFYVDPISEPIAYMGAFVVRAPLLLADQLALSPSSLVLFLPPAGVAVLWVWAIIVLVILSLAFAPLIRHDRTARFWVLGMALCLPPVCATLPHSRLLLFAGLGGMGLLAQWIVAFKERVDWLPGSRGWRRLAGAVLLFLIISHAIIAPVLLPANAVSPTTAEPLLQNAANTAPVGPDVAVRNLVLVNPPSVYYAHYFSTVRAVNGAPYPRHLCILAPGAVSLRVARPDERTLVIRPEGGFLGFPFDNVFRGGAHPLRLGERIALTAMTVEITGLTSDGRPAEATFRFPMPLEEDSFAWLQWRDGKYVHFDPPLRGAEISLPAQQLF
jgi:hypothetical protein